MISRRIFFTLSVLLLTSLSTQRAVSAADSTTQLAEAWKSLSKGTAVILMRHALAPGTGDPHNFKVDDCSTQRNLSDRGRVQAKAIGDTLREKGISQAEILSSEWCRCLETAELLGFEKPTSLPIINSFFQDRSTESSQTDALHAQLNEWISTPDQPVRILVTHQVNISALTSTYASSGDMLIVTSSDGKPKVLAKISTDIE